MRNLVAAVLAAALMSGLGGCAMMTHLDGSSQDAIAEFETMEPGKRETPEQKALKEVKQVEARVSRLESEQVAVKQELVEVKTVSKELAETVEKGIAPGGPAIMDYQQMMAAQGASQARGVTAPYEARERDRELMELKSEVARQKDTIRHLESRMEGEMGIKTGKPERTLKAVYSKADLKVKVLSGDGKMDSARAMARRLRDGGYKVDRVDPAPKQTFSSDVIFHARGFESAASEMAEALGGDIKLKPITWGSIYEIIVVDIE